MLRLQQQVMLSMCLISKRHIERRTSTHILQGPLQCMQLWMHVDWPDLDFFDCNSLPSEAYAQQRTCPSKRLPNVRVLATQHHAKFGYGPSAGNPTATIIAHSRIVLRSLLSSSNHRNAQSHRSLDLRSCYIFVCFAGEE